MNRRILGYRVESLDADGLAVRIEERERGQPKRERVVRLNPRDVLDRDAWDWAAQRKLTTSEIILRLIAAAEAQEGVNA